MVKKQLNKMMKILQAFNYLLPVVFIGFSGCSKSGGSLTNTGTIIQEERRLGNFDSINVQNYVNLLLTQDSVNKVVVEAGENVISGITTEVINNQLFVNNTLKFNWLRSYTKPINVYISVKNLQKIYYNASGNITCTDTLRSSGLIIDIWGGCGSINLNLNIGTGFFLMHLGTVDVTLRGKCAVCSIYQGDYGILKCGELRSGYNYVTNKGSNDCYVNAWQYLNAIVGSIGNIYYTGNPDTVKAQITGTGQLIPY
jgi:hypothetical protein